MPKCAFCSQFYDEDRIAYQTPVIIVGKGRIKQVETMSLCHGCIEQMQETYAQFDPTGDNRDVTNLLFSIGLVLLIGGLPVGIFVKVAFLRILGFVLAALGLFFLCKTAKKIADFANITDLPKPYQHTQEQFIIGLDLFCADAASKQFHAPAYAVQRAFFSPEYTPQRLQKETGMPLSVATELREMLDRSNDSGRGAR